MPAYGRRKCLQFCRPKLRLVFKVYNFSARLPGKAAGQGCRTRLPDKAAGQGCRTRPHSGGNDRFCARLKTDISAFSSGLQGHLRSCLTILDSSRRPLSKNVRHDLARPQRPELEAEMSVFNLAQKRSFPPLCYGTTRPRTIIKIPISQ
jgi:hypothetical protein